MSQLRVACQQGELKTFPGPGYLRSENGVSLPMAFTGKFVYIYLHIYIFSALIKEMYLSFIINVAERKQRCFNFLEFKERFLHKSPFNFLTIQNTIFP